MTNIIKLSNIPDQTLILIENIKPTVSYFLEQDKLKIKKILKDKPTNWNELYKINSEEEIYLSRLMSALSNILSTNHTKELEEIYQEVSEQITNHNYSYFQNKNIYQIYKNLENQDLDNTQRLILKRTLRGFEEYGINLNKEEQDKLKNITIDLEKLTNEYDSNTIQTVEEFEYLVKEEDLEGLPENTKNVFKKYAKEKNIDGYLIKLVYPYDRDIIKFCKNRELRKLVYKKSCQIASEFLLDGKYDNYPLMEKIVDLRNQQAKLVGYKNYSESSLTDKMAKNEDNVLNLLNQLKDRSKPFAINDFNIIKNYALTKDNIELEEHDFSYYVNLYKKEKLDFDTEKLREYFPINKVITGLLWLIKELFSVEIKFKEHINDNSDLYEVVKNNGELSYIIMDLFARKGKSSGAWVGQYASYIDNENFKQSAVAFLVCNFSKQEDGNSFLTMNDVETLFHEMGHALHLTLTDQKEESVSGFNGVPFDGIELPSQLMEYFCYEPKVLLKISEHKETGLTIPQELIKKMKDNNKFLLGYDLLRQVEFSLIDILIYNSTNENHYDIYHKLKNETSLFKIDNELRFLNEFSHIYSGGYAVGYYGYKWADVLSADVFEEFKNNGVISNEVGKKYLNTILSKGGSKEFGELFKEFKGREPDSKALFKHLFD